MKKLVILLVLFVSCLSVMAQTDSIPIYLRYPKLPEFTIRTVPDSLKFTREDLDKKKSYLVMIFNPDCEHCRQVIRDLMAHAELFEKTQIIMVSAFRFSNIRQLYEDLHMEKYPNIIVGRDAAYNLGTFYNVRSLPSIYAYDKKRKFLEKFEGHITAEKIAAVL